MHDGGGPAGMGATPAEEAYDSDGGGVDVASLASGLLDLLIAMASASKLYRLLEPVLADVFHAVIGIAQIEPVSEGQWEADTSQYLQDEDPDSFAATPRVAAQQAVDELLDAYGKRAAPALALAAGGQESGGGSGRGGSAYLKQVHSRSHASAFLQRDHTPLVSTPPRLLLSRPFLGCTRGCACRVPRWTQPSCSPSPTFTRSSLAARSR